MKIKKLPSKLGFNVGEGEELNPESQIDFSVEDVAAQEQGNVPEVTGDEGPKNVDTIYDIEGRLPLNFVEGAGVELGQDIGANPAQKKLLEDRLVKDPIKFIKEFGEEGYEAAFKILGSGSWENEAASAVLKRDIEKRLLDQGVPLPVDENINLKPGSKTRSYTSGMRVGRFVKYQEGSGDIVYSERGASFEGRILNEAEQKKVLAAYEDKLKIARNQLDFIKKTKQYNVAINDSHRNLPEYKELETPPKTVGQFYQATIDKAIADIDKIKTTMGPSSEQLELEKTVKKAVPDITDAELKATTGDVDTNRVFNPETGKFEYQNPAMYQTPGSGVKGPGDWRIGANELTEFDLSNPVAGQTHTELLDAREPRDWYFQSNVDLPGGKRILGYSTYGEYAPEGFSENNRTVTVGNETTMQAQKRNKALAALFDYDTKPSKFQRLEGIARTELRNYSNLVTEVESVLKNLKLPVIDPPGVKNGFIIHKDAAVHGVKEVEQAYWKVMNSQKTPPGAVKGQHPTMPYIKKITSRFMDAAKNTGFPEEKAKEFAAAIDAGGKAPWDWIKQQDEGLQHLWRITALQDFVSTEKEAIGNLASFGSRAGETGHVAQGTSRQVYQVGSWETIPLMKSDAGEIAATDVRKVATQNKLNYQRALGDYKKMVEGGLIDPNAVNWDAIIADKEAGTLNINDLGKYGLTDTTASNLKVVAPSTAQTNTDKGRYGPGYADPDIPTQGAQQDIKINTPEGKASVAQIADDLIMSMPQFDEYKARGMETGSAKAAIVSDLNKKGFSSSDELLDFVKLAIQGRR